MSDWIVLFLFGGAVILAMVLVARYQAGRYQDYLARHTAETEKVTANQARLIEQQDAHQALMREQNALMERIATALERKA
jgi:hypothetical protein